MLLDWSARQRVAGKRGRTPNSLKPIFERLTVDPRLWINLVNSFGKLFYNVAGLPVTIEAATSRVSQRRFYLPAAARELFSTAKGQASAS